MKNNREKYMLVKLYNGTIFLVSVVDIKKQEEFKLTFYEKKGNIPIYEIKFGNFHKLISHPTWIKQPISYDNNKITINSDFGETMVFDSIRLAVPKKEITDNLLSFDSDKEAELYAELICGEFTKRNEDIK